MKYLDRFLSRDGDESKEWARGMAAPAPVGPTSRPRRPPRRPPSEPTKGALAISKGASAGSGGSLPTLARVSPVASPTTRSPTSDGNFAGHLTPESVRLGDLTCHYSTYEGTAFEGIWIEFDTETALIQGNQIPDLALASASDGSQHCLIHPDRVGSFILDHAERDYICHNVAFDFWVVARHLELRGESEALDAWWAIADDNRLHDSMLLDQLIHLARHDSYPRPRNLAVVADEYAGLPLDKADPYRMRYAEIIGVDWSAVDPGFFHYAIKDPIATLVTYQVMVGVAIDLMEAHGYDPS